jgi:uncharacterized cupredoxin-like copper-binding protein
MRITSKKLSSRARQTKSNLLRAALVLWAALVTTSALADEETQKIPQHPAIAAADWSKVKTVTIELDDNNYEPSDLTLKRGAPYNLVLKNIGKAAHDIVSGSLFDKDVAALRMINTVVGRVTAENISSVFIRPKQAAEVWIVPLKTGTYSFFCSIPGHREAGMEGRIHIVD